MVVLFEDLAAKNTQNTQQNNARISNKTQNNYKYIVMRNI